MSEGEIPERIRVLIVDDHEVVALGLEALLRGEADLEVVDIAGSIAEAMGQADRHRPDVVLVDYRLPDGTGADLARQLAVARPESRIVMITSAADRRVLADALDAGCIGSSPRTRIEVTWPPQCGAPPRTRPTSLATC